MPRGAPAPTGEIRDPGGGEALRQRHLLEAIEANSGTWQTAEHPGLSRVDGILN